MEREIKFPSAAKLFFIKAILNITEAEIPPTIRIT